jgi:hypothetical protein
MPKLIPVAALAAALVTAAPSAAQWGSSRTRPSAAARSDAETPAPSLTLLAPE